MTALNTYVESQIQQQAADGVSCSADVPQNTDVANQAQQQETQSRAPFFIGVDTALQDAVPKAPRRAIALHGYVATWRDVKIVYDTEP